MTPPPPVITTDTQNLGNTAPAGPTPYQPMPRKKGGCCSCGCLSGCLGVILLIIGMGVGFWYFVLYDAHYVQRADTVISWTYYNVARPKIIDTFSAGMSDQERQQFLQMTDSGVQKYMTLPPEEKQAILSESTTALYYLWTQQVLPPEKIPHLKAFADRLQQDWEQPMRQMQQRQNQPSPFDGLPKEPPRPSIPDEKPMPRLLN